MTSISTVHPARQISTAIPKKPVTKKKINWLKVQSVFNKILLAIAAVTFMLLQTPVFWVGLIIGYVKRDAMLEMTARITKVWKERPGLSFVVSLAGFAFCFPIMIMSTAFFLGGYSGALLSTPKKSPPNRRS